MRAILVAALLLMAGQAEAQSDHTFYALSIDLNSVAFIDRASVQGQRPNLEAWVLFVYSPTVNRTQHSLTKAAFNCVSETMRFVYTVSYDEKGQVVGTPRAGTAAAPVVPGTVGETLLRDACATKRDSYPEGEKHSVNEAVDFAKGAMDFLQKMPKKK